MRWGKDFVDNRDWPAYNEELVLRGEFLLDLSWVKSWDKETEEMNKGKVGRPFDFPESLIRMQAVWNQYLSYRAVEGLTRQLVAFTCLPEYDDYTTAFRRIKNIDTRIELPKQDNFSLAFDGTGMKMNDGGEYRHDHYDGRKKKQWIRLNVAVDVKTKELVASSVEFAGEGLSEPETAQRQIEYIYGHEKKVLRIFGDGAYDTFALFNFLESMKIDSSIPVQKNAKIRMGESPRRSLEVFERNQLGYEKWAEDREYGLRWGVEGYYSALKRVFGEATKAKTKESMVEEIKRRVWAFEMMRRHAKTRA